MIILFYSLRCTFRLKCNYEASPEDQDYVLSTAMYDQYLKDSEKMVEDLKPKTTRTKLIACIFGTILRRCFPDVSNSKKRVGEFSQKTGRSAQLNVWKYLRKKPEEIGDISYDDIPGIIKTMSHPTFQIIPSEKGDSYWGVVLLSQANILGKDLIKHIEFHRDQSLSVKVGSFSVPLNQILWKDTYELKMSCVTGIVESVLLYEFCPGFLDDELKETRATTCLILFAPLKATGCCKSCKFGKQNLKYKKIREEQKAREERNGEMDEGETEMEQENKEIQDILERIHPSMARNEALAELVKCQKDVLSSTSRKTYRWPKRFVF